MSEQPPAQSELRSQLQRDSNRKRGLLIGIIAAALVAVVAVVIGFLVSGNNNGNGGAGDNGSAGDNGETPAERYSVRIAVAEDREWYDTLTAVAAEGGLDIEWVATDDWVLPNTELKAGSVDANAFQHILYLSAFNVSQDAEIVPVFSTLIAQWGIFSKNYDSLDDVQDGDTVLIPDDPSNGARALYLLEAAGLIEIDADAGFFPTIDDIVDNPQNLQFREVAGTTIRQYYDDPTIAIAIAGLSYFDPAQGVTVDSALYIDDPTNEANLPYINVVAVQAGNEDNPAWKILEEAYADQRVRDAVFAEFGDTLVFVDVPVAELLSKLAGLEDAARAAG